MEIEKQKPKQRQIPQGRRSFIHSLKDVSLGDTESGSPKNNPNVWEPMPNGHRQMQTQMLGFYTQRKQGIVLFFKSF